MLKFNAWVFLILQKKKGDKFRNTPFYKEKAEGRARLRTLLLKQSFHVRSNSRFRHSPRSLSRTPSHAPSRGVRRRAPPTSDPLTCSSRGRAGAAAPAKDAAAGHGRGAARCPAPSEASRTAVRRGSRPGCVLHSGSAGHTRLLSPRER